METNFIMPKFEKLNGDNFAMWKLQMIAYIKLHKIMDVVDRTRKPDSTTISDIEKWKMADSSAILAILTAIDQNQREYISSAKSTAVM